MRNCPPLVAGNPGPPGPDYPPTPIVGDHPLSGPPGPGYIWFDDRVNYTYGIWIKETADAAQKR